MRLGMFDTKGLVVAVGAGAAEPLINAQHAETVTCMNGLEQLASMGM